MCTLSHSGRSLIFVKVRVSHVGCENNDWKYEWHIKKVNFRKLKGDNSCWLVKLNRFTFGSTGFPCVGIISLSSLSNRSKTWSAESEISRAHTHTKVLLRCGAQNIFINVYKVQTCNTRVIYTLFYQKLKIKWDINLPNIYMLWISLIQNFGIVF